jgi:predicted small lipoprotein YifL
MRNCYALFVIVVLLFAISGCGIKVGEANFKSETEKTTTQSSEPSSPIYDSIEYWDIVQDEIVAMLNEHNLYVSAINSSYPCVLYEVEPGIRTENGQIMASGLSQEEYEELYLHIKEELHTILDKYVLAKPKTAFHACDSIVGVYFKNWFIDMPMLPGVNSWQVASYELDLLEYYHEYEDNSYISKDGFHTEVWSKYVVYAP